MIDYMLNGIFNGKNFQVLTKGLDVAALRHKAISQNIANVNTPGYKIKKVSFEDSLQRSLNGYGIKGTITNSKHIPLGRLEISQIRPKLNFMTNTSYRNDKNNVDIDTEMAKLAKNNLIYQTITESLNREISKTRLVITRDGG
jgi:flagellar basal-body rod protein FlgB